MTEEGIVKSVNNGFCEVVVRRKTACGDNCANCGGGCRLNFQSVAARNDIGAEAGDCVIIEMDSGKVLISAFLVYILPLLVFVSSYFIIGSFSKSGIAAGAVSAVMTVIAFGFSVFYDRKHKHDFMPVVTNLKKKT